MRMRPVSWMMFAGALGALAFGCSGENPATTTKTDTSGGGSDAGPPPQDAGPPPQDSGPPPQDAGPPPPPSDPTAKIFDLTELHIIDIEVDPMYLDELDNDPDVRIPCKVTFDGKELNDTGCRKKGGYGSVQPLDGKPGFSLKFNEFVEGQDLYGETRLLLNNAVQDPSFLNEHLGYEVYRRAGIPAARTAHGIVRFNGETKGLYVVLEAIDKKYLERHFGKGNEEGNLYEAFAGDDFVTDPMAMDLKDEIDDMKTRDDILELSQLVQTLPDDQFEAQITPKLDLTGFITGYAIDAIFYHWDGYSYWVINNYYMYHNPATDRFLFMPHGMDQLFDDINFDIESWPNGRLSQRVREIPNLDAQFHDSITTVLKDIWDVPYLHSRIDQVTAVVNSNKNADPAAVNDVASYNAHVNEVRYAVAYRKSLLLGEPLGTCGNGAVELGEDCDDGNKVTGDGCSSACFLENCTSAMYAGKTYLFCVDQHSIIPARAICESYGAALAVPENAAENDWLVSTALSLANESYWIGVDDEKMDGTYVKPDGTPVTFFAWDTGKPNGGTSQNCVALDAAGAVAGAWNDKACSDSYGVLCELP